MISWLFVAALFSLTFFVGSGRFGSVHFCFSGNTGLIVQAETKSLYARCLMGSYERWAEEVGSGEVRSTTHDILRMPRSISRRDLDLVT